MEDRIPTLASNSLPIFCMVWNVQGAGSKAFLIALKELVKVHKPNIIALVETHMGGNHAEKIANLLHYSGHTRVDAQGFSGGIWIFWQPELVTMEPILKHDQFITMDIKRVGGEPWYFTAIYASPDPTKRTELWQHLRDFATNNNKPWLLAGDFNDTRFTWERSSSCAETSRRTARFNEWVEEMGLLEVEFSGPSHTWARGNSLETRTSARLDRALCNGEWSLKFANAALKNLPAIQSDHCPLLISPNGFVPISNTNCPFRFQAAWLSHEQFSEFMEHNWDKTAPLVSHLAVMAEKLQDWNSSQFHNIFKQKRMLMARISGVQCCLAVSRSRDLIKLEAKLRKNLDEVLAQEELLWYQKSRVEWIRDGDRNTTFFHLSTIARRWCNRISAIKDSRDGTWLHDKEAIKNNVVAYFKDFSQVTWLHRVQTCQLISFQNSLRRIGAASLVLSPSAKLRR
ncbi:uncharacterized protein LOC104883619 [Beta vulgaris subsp. vulgaris]|uniref:uncharacterized protein LOC104883619 n=1 Tax=Beta vulgaris subsp. vulgaris TaxID=3555 RepID=UPI00053F517C|nr:uncharacterized protein LOC104883619 [Beta vulgaris subsp. vulgaris]